MKKSDGRGMDHQTLEHLRVLAVKRVGEDGEAPSEVMIIGVLPHRDLSVVTEV